MTSNKPNLLANLLTFDGLEVAANPSLRSPGVFEIEPGDMTHYEAIAHPNGLSVQVCVGHIFSEQKIGMFICRTGHFDDDYVVASYNSGHPALTKGSYTYEALKYFGLLALGLRVEEPASFTDRRAYFDRCRLSSGTGAEA